MGGVLHHRLIESAMLRAGLVAFWEGEVSMTQGNGTTPKRHGKQKEGTKRKDKGRKIVVRLDEEEDRRLREIIGDRSISDFVRAKLFGGNPESGERSRIVYRKIAALHKIGLQLSQAAGKPNVSTMEINGLLLSVRSIILELSYDVDPPSR